MSAPIVQCATWLTPDTLVLTGFFNMIPGGPTAAIRVGDEWVGAGAPDVLPDASEKVPGLVVLAIRDHPRASAGVSAVRLGSGAEIELAGLVHDIGQLLRCGLASASTIERDRALAFLVRVATKGLSAMPSELAANLTVACRILRESLPAAIIDRSLAPSAEIELMVRVDPHHVYFRGWIGRGPSDLARVSLVSPEGARANVPPSAFRFSRQDVVDFYGIDSQGTDEFGVASLCEFESPTWGVDGWSLEIETKDHTSMEVICPPLIDALHEARDRLVAEMALEQLPSEALRAHHLLPAITRIQSRLSRSIRIARTEQFGVPPKRPEVSIIVPLYKRLEFVEHQLAQFVHDPEIARADLIYVLDSPEQEQRLLAEAERLARLYPVPFRVAVLSANGGYSTANNLGMTLARGPLALLMNSDVLPDEPGWLGKLVAFHRGLSNPGAVAPKLVYEDDSLQHAGMYFERPIGARLWANEHYFKGMHRSFAAACRNRPVPAVTAACLLVRTSLYRDVQGLHGTFIQGDFEDSDLCLRLHERGCENWYAADVTLYHLEGQSYPSAQRHANGEFNRWLHTHLWDRRIASLMTNENRRITL
jgi:GT2 family glycosyltransferase